jgi:predicted GIY-YIG superfamily endonuclease
MDWKFYIIFNKKCSYAGVTPNIEERIKKHNGELSGGAKYTKSKGSGWKYICVVYGFPTKQNAMQFEWAVKHCMPRNARGIENRMKKLIDILSREKWTSNSPLASSIPLRIEWHNTEYKPKNYKLNHYIEEEILFFDKEV